MTKDMTYEEYLAGYHGMKAPLTREMWKRSFSGAKGITNQNPKDILGLKKVPLHLIPSSPLARLAMVMKLGAQKYGAYNWRDKEVKLTIYIDAAERHLRAILDGESIDQESGQHHAAHVMACMAIILDAFDLEKLVDDRPLPGNFPNIIKELEL